jgi:hypothetical protein
MKWSLIVLVVFGIARADWAPLDLPYGKPMPPKLTAFWYSSSPPRNDLKSLIDIQTPVKHQRRRGLCSIFSAVGIYESLLKRETKIEFDLSENYLAYIVVGKIQGYPSRGSNAVENFRGVAYPGIIEESVWPYEGDDWKAEWLSEDEIERRDQACFFEGLRQELCLITHLDPREDPHIERA